MLARNVSVGRICEGSGGEQRRDLRRKAVGVQKESGPNVWQELTLLAPKQKVYLYFSIPASWGGRGGCSDSTPGEVLHLHSSLHAGAQKCH